MIRHALVCILFAISVRGDTPANCTYEDIRGTWLFSITKTDGDNSINCNTEVDYVTKYSITLDFPDLAVDENGNTGFWTLIYNQGFEVVLDDKKFFGFSLFKKSGREVESICDKTSPGWVHNINERNWGCFVGQKMDTVSRKKLTIQPKTSTTDQKKYFTSKSFVEKINGVQSSWKATQYTVFEGKNISDVISMAGGRRSAGTFPSTSPVTKHHLEATKLLPKEFDWRNRDGVNFVSPIRNQKSCGSCYAFGSMAQYEARLRIATNNTVQKVFSTQDIVSCSEYSQGCDGGFPYLIAGKYAQDFGLIEDECFPYQAKDTACMKTSCQRHYTQDYYYVGGFYGACNEPLMREELVKNGPMAVSFQVYNDFVAYKSGIYHHSGLEDKFNPWEITNHVVLVVGYGEEEGQPFWIVKNSWGTEWGEDGFFRIRRATDECSIESMAVGITVLV